MITHISAKPTDFAPRRVLVVDDEPLFLRSFVDRLAEVGERENFQVFAASDGRKALEVLDAEPIDVLITDLRMPELDGFGLLAAVIERKLRLSVIAISANASGEAIRGLGRLGVFSFLAKPFDFYDVLAILRDELAARSAHIDGINLAAFLQLLALERTRGVVIVRSEAGVGRILVADGNLLGADVGDLQGLPAAYHLLAAPSPTLELREQAALPATDLSFPLMEIVLEAVRRQDEARRSRPPQPSLSPDDITFDLMPSTPPGAAPATAVTIPRAPLAPALEPHGPAATAELAPTLSANPEKSMNIEKANHAIEKLQESLGGGLIAADIWIVHDGMSIAGYNTQPVATALFNRMTNQLNETLSESGFPGLNRYYLLDLDTDKLVVVLPCGDLRAGFLVDKKKVQLGIVISVALPKFQANLDAILS